MTEQVKSGADILVRENFKSLSGMKVALMCNQTSVVSGSLKHLADLLHESGDLELAMLFAPEHGIRGEAQDMDPIHEQRDIRTGIPVCSLYRTDFESLAPSPESLAQYDILLIDIQDTGTRYYTFAATMALCMKSAAAAGIPVMILDRPNPLGGEEVEGPGIKPGFESFVGLYSIPVRHGMTLAELALWYNLEEDINCDLKIVSMEGWRRFMFFEDTHLAWVPPSPNMPSTDTAFVYPGMCLVEGTMLSEGRGTTKPFEQCGAPFIDPYRLVEKLNKKGEDWGLDGIIFRPCSFRPMFHKHEGEVCNGAYPHVMNRRKLQPWKMGVLYLEAIHDLWPNDLKWRTETYEFVKDIPAIDLLFGSSDFRTAWESGKSVYELVHNAGKNLDFINRRKSCLLYD